MTAKRVVTTEQGQEFCDSFDLGFLETSAKNSTNVEKAFTTMATQIKKSYIFFLFSLKQTDDESSKKKKEKINLEEKRGKGEKQGGGTGGCC